MQSHTEYEYDIMNPVRLRQRRIRGDTPRARELLARERFNLNSGYDCAVSESVALASLLPSGVVLAERDLLFRVGWGHYASGTPDGAVLLAGGGMHAVQVVRAGVGDGAAGGRGQCCAALLRVLLEKVVKSSSWLLENSALGGGVVVFTVACWVPHALSKTTRTALRRALKRSARDPRFEFELLVPANRSLRRAVFPALFGSVVSRRPATTPTLLAELRALAARFTRAGGGGDDDDDYVGILGLLLAAA